MPLLRELHGGLRYGMIFFDAMVLSASSGEIGEPGNQNERAGEERNLRCGWTCQRRRLHRQVDEAGSGSVWEGRGGGGFVR